MIQLWVEFRPQKMAILPDRIVKQNQMSVVTLKIYKLHPVYVLLLCLEEFLDSRQRKKEVNQGIGKG